MPHPHFTGKLFALVAAGLLAAGPLTPALAEEASAANPLALRKIMRELGDDARNITDAISREDWARIKEISPRLAEHPHPPVGERIRVLTFLGADASRFKALDEGTHEAARALGEAAARGDGKAVIGAFANLQTNCLACHQSFRKPFIAHFYGAR